MTDQKSCANHPDRKATSFCHVCKGYFCPECLVEGPDYYYCKADACQREYSQAVQDQRSSEEPPEPPIAEEEKAWAKKEWVDKSFLWLIEEFGEDTLRSVAVVTPTPEFFPNPYDTSPEAAASLVHTVCGYMHVDPARLDLRFYQDRACCPDSESIWDSPREGAAGRFYRPGADGKVILGLEMSNLEAPHLLVAAAAHELAHVHLLADLRLTGKEDDHEPMADLLTVFLGLGVFTANAVFQFSRSEEGLRHGWKASTMGYLPEPMYGYALAAFCWMRQELKPSWSKYLASNIEHYRKRFLKDLDIDEGAGLPILGPAPNT
jgi:hypothetical protein